MEFVSTLLFFILVNISSSSYKYLGFSLSTHSIFIAISALNGTTSFSSVWIRLYEAASKHHNKPQGIN